MNFDCVSRRGVTHNAVGVLPQLCAQSIDTHLLTPLSLRNWVGGVGYAVHDRRRTIFGHVKNVCSSQQNGRILNVGYLRGRAPVCARNADIVHMTKDRTPSVMYRSEEHTSE